MLTKVFQSQRETAQAALLGVPPEFRCDESMVLTEDMSCPVGGFLPHRSLSNLIHGRTTDMTGSHYSHLRSMLHRAHMGARRSERRAHRLRAQASQ